MKENIGIKLIKGLAPLQNSSEEFRIQYLVTEDGLPIYEVNRWIQTVSRYSYQTGENYGGKLCIYLRYLKHHQIHYKDVTNKKVIEQFVKALLYGDDKIPSIEGTKTLNYIKQIISVIKGFYEWLEDNGEIDTSPIFYGAKRNNTTNTRHLNSKFLYGQIWEFDIEKSLVKHLRYKNPQNHIKWYSEKEIALILNNLTTLRDKCIFKITIETGMRIGEVLGLRLQDVKEEEGVLSVIKRDNIENQANAKTTERDLYISSQLLNELNYYIRSERAENDIKFSDYLFINLKGVNTGYALKSRNYLAVLKRAAKRAGLDDKQIRTHSGRSTHAQVLLDALHEGEVTEMYILQQMGWSQIGTLKPYTRTYNEKNRINISKRITEKKIQLPKIIEDDETTYE